MRPFSKTPQDGVADPGAPRFGAFLVSLRAKRGNLGDNPSVASVAIRHLNPVTHLLTLRAGPFVGCCFHWNDLPCITTIHCILPQFTPGAGDRAYLDVTRSVSDIGMSVVVTPQERNLWRIPWSWIGYRPRPNTAIVIAIGQSPVQLDP
jgi:hypothetical protein